MGFPNLPGIPPLKSFAPAALTLAAPLTNLLLDMLKSPWGIYDKAGTAKVLEPDSFLSITYHNETNIPVFPLEEGAFGSYNKVATPYDITIRVTKADNLTTGFGFGGGGDLTDFMAALDDMQADVKLYMIKTPNRNYINANLKGVDYKREINNGASILLADLHFVEIMRAPVVVATTTGTTSSPAADGGATASASSFIDNGVASVKSTVSSVVDTVSSAVDKLTSTAVKALKRST